MSRFPRTKKRDKLLDVLTETETTASSLKERAQEVVGSAEFSEGLARHLRPVIESVSDDSALPSQVWTDLTEAWEANNVQTASAINIMASAPSSSATTAAATLTTTASTRILSAWTKREPEQFEALRSFLHRPSLIEQAKALSRQLALDHTYVGSRSALQLLGDAAAALARPAGPSPAPTGVLITAREAVQVALASLLKRRPRQEPTGKPVAKVVSIGEQCGWEGFQPGHFERIGRDLTRLLSRLSAGKDRDFDSNEVQGLWDEVLQFFVAFLGSLDPGKLAPP